jgi:signal transduction histidine kinase
MLKSLIAAGAMVAILGPGAALADDAVTPAEVIAKVREAAAYLGKEGEAGLAKIGAEGSPFIWKDTYVFVYDCAADDIVAHAIPASRGLKISGLKDADGKHYGPELCEAAKVSGGSWGEYVWPKPVKGDDGQLAYTREAFRKVSYMLTVDGHPWQVGAGIYNDPMSLAELDALVPK